MEEIAINAKDKSGKLSGNNVSLVLMSALVVLAVWNGIDPQLRQIEAAAVRLEAAMVKLTQQHDEHIKLGQEHLQVSEQVIEELRRLVLLLTYQQHRGGGAP